MTVLNWDGWRRACDGSGSDCTKPVSQTLINVVPAAILGGVLLISAIVLFFLVRRKKKQEKMTEDKERESLEIDIYPTAQNHADMHPGLFVPEDPNLYPDDKRFSQYSSSSTPYGGPSTTSLHRDGIEASPSRAPLRPGGENSETEDLPTRTSSRVVG